ncbi:hypothetical protein N431DRAFT_469835 [Stipitochalara longipes BDJ]|nr:hypothetical protein N431DRAFT_469835 [Stipitochalara longipes BDJ]
MPRAKRSESEVKEMVCKELQWRKPFYSAYPDGEELASSNGDGSEVDADEFFADPSIPPPNACPLWDRLVPVRLMILRQLLVRPAAIVLGPVDYKLSIEWREKPVFPWYRYQWNDSRQQAFEEYGLPSCNGETKHLQIAWRSKPTIEQQREIEAGNLEGNALNNELRLLGSTWDDDIQVFVGPLCINILRACKKLNAEGIPLLYGENTFAFDTRRKSPYTHHGGIHADVFNTNAHHIPGYKADLWDEVISAAVTVANNGTVDGNEVSQLYVQYPDVADQPVRQLRGFERTLITSGSSFAITFSIRRRDLSMWDVEAQEWAIVNGDYVFSVGASSRDLRVSQTLTI